MNRQRMFVWLQVTCNLMSQLVSTELVDYGVYMQAHVSDSGCKAGRPWVSGRTTN